MWLVAFRASVVFDARRHDIIEGVVNGVPVSWSYILYSINYHNIQNVVLNYILLKYYLWFFIEVLLLLCFFTKVVR